MRTTKTRKPSAKKSPAKRGAAKRPTQKKRAKLWSATEMSILRTSYKGMTTTQIARRLKRTVEAVRTKVRALGLRKAPVRKAAGPRTAARRKNPARRGHRPSRW